MCETDSIPERKPVSYTWEDTLQSAIIKLFFLFMQISTRFTRWYNQNEWVRKICNVRSHIDEFLGLYEIEPIQDSWKCIFWIQNDKLYQTYLETTDELAIVQYKTSIRECKRDVAKEQFQIILMKTPDEYYCNILTEMYKDPRLYLLNEPRELSTVYLMSVNYVYGDDNEKSIPIDVNRKYYVTGNDLYNSTFVYRALKYQSLPFEFTMTYTLQIIDDCANYIELKSDEYIRVERDSYVIKKMDSTTESD